MKRSELFFNFILVPIDILMVFLAFVSAYSYRSKMEIIYIWPYDQYLHFVLMVLPFWIVIFALAGLYSSSKNKRFFDQFASIVLGISSGVMLVVAWIFLSRTFFFSRLVVVYAWVFALIYVTLGRLLVGIIQIYLYRYGIGTHQLIIIGDGDTTDLIIKEMQNNPSLGYRLIGLIQTKNNNSKNHSKILGKIEDFEKIISSRQVDDVILADSSVPEKTIANMIDFCHNRRIIFKEVPNFFQVQTANVKVSSLATIPIVEFMITPITGWGRILKRLLDTIGSLIGIIIFSPFMIISAIILKFDSPGPVIYKNERVGKAGKKFFLYKFRTMKIEYCTGDKYGGKSAEDLEKKLIKEKNERVGPVYKVLGDPRRTKFGKFLERSSIDELPQFFNVLMGQMSLVGPRPHQPREVDKYQSWHKKVLRIKPGITGMAQIAGRSDLDFDDEARLDIYYIENWSLWLDIKIILKTPFALIKPRKNV